MSRFSISPQIKTFLLGLSISVLILTSFFAGAIADRIFVLKPLDFVIGNQSLSLREALNRNISNSNTDSQGNSLLGSLLQSQDFGVADVVEATSDSVITVSIKSERRVLDPFESFFGFNPFGSQQLTPPRIEQIQKDIGTGFVVDGNLIVTNRHVVSNPNAEYLIIDTNDVEYEVVDIYRDPQIDLAILKVRGAEALPALDLGDSESLRVGQGVIAIGTALGEFRHTVTTGVVSGLGRGIEATDGRSLESLEGVIQTDAAINPGNSGGPLLNSRGQVIGVNVATSAYAENIGFAIPINTVKASLENFNQTGQFERPFMGIRYQVISEQAALLNEVPQGAYLVEVLPESTASEAGLQQGDIITKFDGVAVKDENLAALINSKKIGDRVSVTYWRDTQERTAQVTLRGQ